MVYRYYLKLRAPSPGAQPSGFVAMKDYGTKQLCTVTDIFFDNIYFKAWGYVDYKEKLSVKQVEDFEMVYGGKWNADSN